jgi:hypothetical protein
MRYRPKPIDTSGIPLAKEIFELIELLAKNAHDNWALQRLAQGWRYGLNRNDMNKEHPCLVPYEDLPDAEREYDRTAAMETLKAIIALGYKIEKG